MSEESGGGGTTPPEPAVDLSGPAGPARVTAPQQAAIATLSADAPQLQVAAKNPRRAELAVAVGFLLAFCGFGAFGGAYWVNASTQWLGGSLTLGFAGFGFALVSWGKYLMPQGPFVEERHLMAQTEEDRERFIGDFASRGKIAIERRSFLVKLMGLAGAVLGVVVAFPLLRSLGPNPGTLFTKTHWKKGSRLITIDSRPVKVTDLEVGGILTVFPEGDPGGDFSQTVLIRPYPAGVNVVTRPGRETWGPEGYLAYSKVCTHAGCPVGLYQELTQQLLCPCHQSLFDVLEGAEPVFGPAPRPLPQLPLYVDSAGYLRAQAPFDEPIGPGYWYRGND